MGLSNKYANGAIAWMTRHGVAANLLMLICIFGGLIAVGNIKQEVFPEFQSDIVRIEVAYPGASPEEVESGIVLAVEDAISDLDGIKEVNSIADEGMGLVLVEAVSGVDVQRLAQNAQQEINRINSFPLDAEKPIVKVMARKRQVISLVLYGQAEASVLHALAEQFREHLLQDPNITSVELEGVRPLEISIEISQENLRRYHLTLAEVAQRLQKASVDLPGGSVKAEMGEILIRMKARKDYGRQFAKIPIITASNGSEVLLGDIATIKDGYSNTGYAASYNQQPAVMVQVYSTGKQTPIQVSEAVKARIESIKSVLPQGVKADIRLDSSKQYGERVGLLVSDSLEGLALVFLALVLFLEFRFAFWVVMEIPTAFLGSFLILPLMGVTINMVSLFAFMIAIGIVVDDAIVIGENIYDHRRKGMSPLQAAIEGTRSLAMPVTFGVLINMVAFVPLYFMPGDVGKTFIMIPSVILCVFTISIIESLYILPNHLVGHVDKKPAKQHWLVERQQRFSNAFEHWVQDSYGSFLKWILYHRYLTIVIALVMLVMTLSYILSGRMGMSAFPKTESDFAKVTVTMPYGTSEEKTAAIVGKIIAGAQQTAKTINRGDELIQGIFSEVGKNGERHKGEIRAYLAPPEIREGIISTEEFNQRWRQAIGDFVGVDSVWFESDAGGPGSGASVTVEFNHSDLGVLEKASKELAEVLRGYPIAKDVDDGFSPGKQQLDFTLLPEGRSLGLTAESVARQVRNAFYGAEVLRQQRGRNEIKVMVRLPESERIRQSDVGSLLIWTNSGKEVPINEVVSIKLGRAYTEIDRHNGRRNIQVTANVIPKSKAREILNDLEANVLPKFLEKYPGLQYGFEGQEAAVAESVSSLKISFFFAVLTIYCLLAILFESYSLPLIVVVSIPFGIIGAAFGHFLLGYNLTIISLLGIVSLSGVAVNDALVLIDHVVTLSKSSHQPAIDQIRIAAMQRFRPILLTTMTTFGGMMPMIFETSRQARFLIPMAISIGFGILFTTLITLVLIPSLYVVIEDVQNLWRKIRG